MFFRLGLVFVLAFAFSSEINAAPGNLDTSFGNGGTVFTDFNGFGDEAGSIIILPDGMIVVGGYSLEPTLFSYVFALTRYNTNGSLDTTFGTNGKVLSGFQQQLDNFALSLNLQPDGKIVAAGYLGTSGNAIALSRYNSNGSLDTSFNGNGTLAVYFNSGNLNAKAYSSAMQPDGKILAAGSVRIGNDYDFALVRVNPNGTLDTSFGVGGRVTTPFGNLRDEARSLEVLPDGKILVVGLANNGSNSDLAIAKYNVDGSLDTSFDADGKVMSPIGTGNDFGYSLAVLPGGGFLVAGESFAGVDFDSLLAKFTSGGQLDTLFGSNGIVLTSFSSAGNDSALSLAIQQNGKIITSGYTGSLPNRNFAIARFDQTGSLDLSFNGSGKIVSDFGNSDELITDVKLQRDGKVVACGLRITQGNPQTGDFVVARYEGDPVLRRASFDYDADGRADLSVRRASDNIWYILRGTAGYFNIEFGVAGDMIAPADYDGDGKTDVAVFRPSNGTWYIFNSQSQSFTTIGWGASGDMPVPADHDCDGRADLVVFRPSTNTWYTRFSSNNNFSTVGFGVAGDKPVVGDFDADGKADIALYRPSESNWYILKTGFGFFAQTWGQAGDIPVPADYDGDGATDVAVFRPSTGQWFRIRSTAGFDTVGWGQAGDQPIPADYDGDGKSDVAVFRPSNSTWYIVGSTSGQLVQNYGVSGDVPTQGAFIY